MTILRLLAQDCDGAAAIEYLLIASVVALMIIIGFTGVGSELGGLYKGLGSDAVAATPAARVVHVQSSPNDRWMAP